MNFEKLSVLLQYIVPQRGLTALAGWLGNNRSVWLKNFFIRTFIRRYDVDMSLATTADLANYPSFNSFFTRHIKAELRPIAADPRAFVSPADGAISQLGPIANDRLLQAKGFDFSLQELLAGYDAEKFQDGKFITIYLSPKDYHRVHMPITGTLRKTIFIPGKLFSVNQKTARAVPQLFARNERLVCLFDTEIGTVAVILVGAMLVGSIGTIWQETTRENHIKVTDFADKNGLTIQRGEELGHFKMGSTVILPMPEGKLEWDADLHANSPVCMGQTLGKLL